MAVVEGDVLQAVAAWDSHLEGLSRLAAAYAAEKRDAEQARRHAEARAEEVAAARTEADRRHAEQQRAEAEAVRAAQERERLELEAAERAAAEALADAERLAAEQAAAEAARAVACSPEAEELADATQIDSARQAMTPRLLASPCLPEPASAAAAPGRSPLPLCLPDETPCRMEGELERPPSAWRHAEAQEAATESPVGFRMEGAPEFCRSTLRPSPRQILPRPLAAEASVPSPAPTPPSAAPTALQTAVAVRCAKATSAPLQWPSARPSSLAGHPALTPKIDGMALDSLALPAHPIMMRSPESPDPTARVAQHARSPGAQGPEQCAAPLGEQMEERTAPDSPAGSQDGGHMHADAHEAATSPAGSISLDAAADSPAAPADGVGLQREDEAGTPPHAIDVALSCTDLPDSAGLPYGPLLFRPRTPLSQRAVAPVAAPHVAPAAPREAEEQPRRRAPKRARTEVAPPAQPAAPVQGATQTPPAVQRVEGTPGRVCFSARVTHLDSDGDDDAALRDHDRCAALAQPPAHSCRYGASA